MVCKATATEHCCWVPGFGSGVCPHFNPDSPADAGGFCSLRTELGSWDRVHADKRYPKRLVDAKIRCGDYPTRSVCGACGAVPVEVT